MFVPKIVKIAQCSLKLQLKCMGSFLRHVVL